eukprot:4398150-Pyramimonas_sp.AAC.1
MERKVVAQRDAKRGALYNMSGDTNGSLAYYQPRLRRMLHSAHLPKPARVARVGCLLNVNPRVGYAWACLTKFAPLNTLPLPRHFPAGGGICTCRLPMHA